MKNIVSLTVLFISSLIFFHGCQNNPATPPSNTMDFIIPVYNYSNYNYFLDTAYKSNFLDFEADGQLNAPENIAKQVSNENFEIWVQTVITTADRKMASLLIDLPPLPTGGNYDTSFYRPQQIQGRRYFGLFRKLTASEYYINYPAGFISLKTFVSENDFIGVSYKETGSGKRYGTNSIDFNNDTLVLKMIKPGNVNPQTDTLAWALKMKNVYRIPSVPLLEDGFQLEVNYVNRANQITYSNLPNGRMVLDVVGLDRFVGHGPMLGRDNYFDYIEGRTIIPETGELVFPVLQPFSDEIFSATGDTSLVYREIYTKLQSEASVAPNSLTYIIKGKIRNY